MLTVFTLWPWFSSPCVLWKPLPQPRSQSWPSSRWRPSSTKSRTFLRSTSSSTTPSYLTFSSGTRRSPWDIYFKSWWVWRGPRNYAAWDFIFPLHHFETCNWVLKVELSDSHYLYSWITHLNYTAHKCMCVPPCLWSECISCNVPASDPSYLDWIILLKQALSVHNVTPSL